MRIVLDTNALLVSISKKSPYRPIFDALLQKKYLLVVSNEILTEYDEILSQKTNPVVSHNIIELLVTLPNVILKNVYYKWQLIETDKDDNKFTDAAVAGNADFIVTNDKHFNVLKSKETFPPIVIISVRDFLNKLNEL